MDGRWSAEEAQYVGRAMRFSTVGLPATIRRGLEAILDATEADELILTGQIYEHAARLHSFELGAAVMRDINDARGVKHEARP